jgi:PAS domain S-box-containing protein
MPSGGRNNAAVPDMPPSQAALATREDPQLLLEPFIAAVADYALLLLDPEGRVLSWNRGAEVISGYHADEVIGRLFACLYAPEDVAAGKPDSELQMAALDGRHEAIGERVRNNGARFLANILITAIPGTDGRPRGFGVIMRDITARLAAEDLLKTGAARLRSLMDTVLDAVVDGLVTIDHQGIIQSYNKACVSLFGYAVEEVLGRNVNMLMPEADRRGHDRSVSANLGTGIGRIIGTSREVMGRRKDGSTFPMELAVGELPQGSNQAFLGIIRDLTERHEAEKQREQLRQAQKMEAVGQLTGGLAHDFNNLLAIIVGNLDLLREIRQDDSVTEELVRDALESALRGADLTRRLLAFARRQPLQPERADINEVIGGIVKLLARTLGENIAIELTLSPTTWAVQIDRTQFEAVITNLATNARDAMPRGGTLLITTRNGQVDETDAAAHGEISTGEYVVIEVSDSGCGMPPDTVARIFEPFFTTKGQGKGTGLGLSMVFGFMKQSGGHISVHSEPGEGTTFRLYLPRFETVSIVQGERSTKPASRGGSEAILVVEDNAGLRRIVVRQLSEAGYRVLEATDAAAAMCLIEGPEPIHLLFSDIVMPGEMDGRDLARAAVQRRPVMNVLLTSGFPDARLPGTASRSSDSRLLIKPYRKEELLRAVREAIDDPI